MERTEIIKALECCLVESNCTGCPLRHQYETDCLEYAGKKALSLIKELTEENAKLNNLITEIEKEKAELWEEKQKLTEENERLRGERAKFFEYKHGTLVRNALVLTKNKNEFDDFCKAIKAETVKKMQEKLLHEWDWCAYDADEAPDVINRVAKEMLEGL